MPPDTFFHVRYRPEVPRFPNIAILLLGGLWIVLFLAWPRAANEHTDQVLQVPSAQIQLYGSEITKTDFGLLGARFFESQDNRPTWEIRSHFAELNRSEDFLYMREVDADFFGQNSGNVIHTLSDFGRSYLGQHRVDLEGNVKIRSRSGYVFRMAKLEYVGEKKIFSTESPVQMLGPDPENPRMKLAGKGMIGSTEDEIFRIRSTVSASRRLVNQDWIHIQSNRGDFHTRTGNAFFSKRVRAQMPKIELECDRFELGVGAEEERLLAMGAVRLKNRDRIGIAEKAEILIGSDTIILEGGAQITTDSNHIEGAKITIRSIDDTLDVQTARGNLEKNQSSLPIRRD